MAHEVTVLLADDDALIVEMYKTKLLKEGFNVLVARDGEEAFAMAKQHKPDVIVLDVLMPKVTGVGVLQRLKDDPETKNSPVIFFTNLEGKRENIDTALRLGAVAYLLKEQTTPQLLAEKVRSLIK
ncbi:MAG: response regulator [Candidatus Doudnabacteria bacterium]|nr:response regulator [Candidatus Doudnabacteria bacterium]